MQQAQQQHEPSQIGSVEDFAAAIFDLNGISIDETILSEDGSRVCYDGNSFHYELSQMYLDDNGISRVGEYTVGIPHAGDDGGDREITIESVEINGQRGIVVYDIYQPSTYYDEDWVCSGMLMIILTDPESHASRLKEEVEKIKRNAMLTVKSLVVSLLRNVAEGQELATLVKDVLVDLVDGARYAFDKNEDTVRPDSGDIDSARAIAEAGNAVTRTLDMSYAGACAAEILYKHPLVEAFTMEFTTTQEYDDNNYFTAKNVDIVDLEFVNGVPSATLEDSEGEEIDPVEYADDILDKIRDDSLEHDLYDGFAGHDMINEDFEVKVSRAALKDLLEQDTIDGLAVAKIVLATETGA